MTVTPVKYLRRKTRGKKVFWTFNLPMKAIRDGVTKRMQWDDGRTARTEAIKLNKIVDEWKQGKTVINNLRPESEIKYVITHYLNTQHFNSLAKNSQVMYKNNFRRIWHTPYKTKEAGDLPINSITAKLCEEFYTTWLSHLSVNSSNQTARIFSVLISYAMSLDLCVRNPMASVRKLRHTPKQIIWTKEQVEKFLHVAFSQWKYRNIGLLVYMAYEWAQRPIDIVLLKWANIDFEKKMVTIKQKKRGTEVYLPLYDSLEKLLLDQREDWGFQEWVIPQHNTNDGEFKPYSKYMATKYVQQVLKEAGLPSYLNAGILRKTAITEMIEAEVDILTIKPVTGHKNIQSLNPYLVNTLKASTKALDKRRLQND